MSVPRPTVAPETNWPVVGHQRIIAYLQRSIERGTVAHAYLFVGLSHVGKRTVAEQFGASLLCEQGGATACGQCQSCVQIARQSHPDLMLIEREVDPKRGTHRSTISIEQVRELQRRLGLHSFFNRYKVAIITEAERLGLEASNALLKTLEEPTAKTVIILLAASTASLPLTVASRCQRLTFLPVSTAALTGYLTSQQVLPAAAKTLASLAMGLPGVAIRHQQDAELLRQRAETYTDFVAIHRHGELERLSAIAQLVGQPKAETVKELFTAWTVLLRDVLLTKTGTGELVTHPDAAAELNQLSNRYSFRQLTDTLRGVANAQRQLAANVGARLVLENFLLTLPVGS